MGGFGRPFRLKGRRKIPQRLRRLAHPVRQTADAGAVGAQVFTDSQNCALNDLRPDARTSERKVGQSSAVEPQADRQVMNHMSFLSPHSRAG